MTNRRALLSNLQGTFRVTATGACGNVTEELFVLTVVLCSLCLAGARVAFNICSRGAASSLWSEGFAPVVQPGRSFGTEIFFFVKDRP